MELRQHTKGSNTLLYFIFIVLSEVSHYSTNTRCAWAGGTCVRVSLIFAILVSFMLYTVFTLVYVLYFEEFLLHDSRGFMILKNN
jgi:hypothetical protein